MSELKWPDDAEALGFNPDYEKELELYSDDFRECYTELDVLKMVVNLGYVIETQAVHFMKRHTPIDRSKVYTHYIPFTTTPED